MRLGSMVVTAVSVLTAVTALTGCGSPAKVQVVPAMRVALAQPADPADRRLHLRIATSALADPAQPIDRVDVSREPGQLLLRAWVRERVPATDEAVPNTAADHDWTVELSDPLGDATILDATADPPRPIN